MPMIEVVEPHATLKTSPDTRGARHALRFACTTFATYVKSLDCLPSHSTVGGSFLIILNRNMGITAEYFDSGFCLGPNTLKYRSETVSRPNVFAKVTQ